MPADLYGLGLRVSYYRKKKGMSQVELAEKVGLSEKQIYYIEKGEKGISIDKFVEIANALKVSPDDLLTDSVETTDKNNSTDVFSFLMGCTKAELRFLKKLVKYYEDLLKKIDV